MVLTPDDLERLLREQVRQMALVKQQLDSPPTWLQRARRRLAVLLKDKILVALWAVSVAGIAAAIIMIVGALPLGGESGQSALAIAQGSSLIFVVILVGLLSGPVDAGRRVGLGTTVVASDGRTWMGLGWVALLSLTLLAIGWSKPDPREELATLAITASGLGATGLVARRLLRLSNPEAHLEDQYAKSLKAIRGMLSASKRASAKALEEFGIDAQVATTVGMYVEPSVQRRIAVHARAFTTIAARAWHSRDWILAANAHLFGIAVGHAYLSLIDSIDDQDAVLRTLLNETDDLHELSGGPDGRKLSRALLGGLRSLGVAVAEKDGVVGSDGINPSVYGFIHELGIMLERRLADQKSEDPAAALVAMGDLSVICVEQRAIWSTASTHERILEWATAASAANVIHVAMTAWEESIRILIALAKDAAIASHPLAFDSALRDFVFALRRLDRLPRWSLPSAVGPILRSSTDGTHPTLQAAFYAFWDADESVLEEIADFGRDVVWQFSRLLRTVEDDRQAHIASKDVGEIMYQWICAATTRGSSLPPTNEAHRIVVGSVTNTLGWLRALIVGDEGIRETHDLDELLHMYVSGWQVLLFLLRDADQLTDDARSELAKLLAALTSSDVTALQPNIRDALRLLLGWLSRLGADSESREVAEAAEGLPLPSYGPWGGHSASRWGMGGRSYYTRRGGLVPAVVSEVEEYFGDADGDRQQPDA